MAIVAAGVLYPYWLPEVRRLLSRDNSLDGVSHPPETAHSDTAHEHEGHDHAGHSESTSLEMSEQARKNIGLRVAKVDLAPFTKTVSVPGMVAERPGRSTILVTAPMTGIVTKIYAIEGEALEPGRKLFDLRLTHEELVQSQAELLQTAEELDVTAREIKRIERLTENGGLAGKQLLERQYERQKLEAVLHSKREALLLHGLTESQIDTILKKRELLKELSVVAPPSTDEEGHPKNTSFQVQNLKAAPGQHVNAGDTLVNLANHAELYIQGEAFERDVAAISRAADANANVSATLESEGGRPELVPNLKILYLASRIDPDTRTLDFFVTLPNQLQRDAKLPDGHRFIAWRFRPGQRVQLQIPIETLENRLVLPVEAVAQDGAETFVFTPNGDHLDRRTVHVEYRDTQWAVIANDGSLFAGESVAISSAQQLQLALKNKAGGGIDPHAGHNH
ncbi:MAG: efflux RND transporter periplasmic adaptor subunit [Pirellulales bacterium]